MLKVNDIDVYYGNVPALRGVSVEVNEGELVALIGANGAGKTTLLMTISGIVRPTSGGIEFLKTRIDELPSHAIVNMGLVHVPQGRQLFSEMTVLENLELGAYRAMDAKSKSIEQKLQEVYGYFDVLDQRRNQKSGTLSGGEQQMLAIARALMTSPKLLLLDEPSTGLAPLVVEKLAQIISNIHKEGLPMLLVEQNAYLALELADRGYVLETGSIVVSGSASELSQTSLVKEAYLGL